MWNRVELKLEAKEIVKESGKNAMYAGAVLWLLNLVITFKQRYSANNKVYYFALFTFLAGMILQYMIVNPIRLAIKKYYLNQEDSLDIFYYFRNNYKNVCLVQFQTTLYVALWMMLFIVPGIIKYFKWFYIDYLLIENPNATFKELKEQSEELTNNRKFDIFVLEISFFFWNIIRFIPFIGFWIESYIGYTLVGTYKYCKQDTMI